MYILCSWKYIFFFIIILRGFDKEVVMVMIGIIVGVVYLEVIRFVDLVYKYSIGRSVFMDLVGSGIGMFMVSVFDVFLEVLFSWSKCFF